MAGIKPGEVSQILKQELEGFTTNSELEEVGSVLQVGDGIARIYGLTNVQSNELIEFESGQRGIVLNLEEEYLFANFLFLLPSRYNEISQFINLPTPSLTDHQFVL